MSTAQARPRIAPEAARVSSDRRRIREGILYCVEVFAAVRIGLFLVVLVSVALLPDATRIPNAESLAIPGPVGVPGWAAHATTPGWHNVFTGWERFDALWFLRIAAGGYRSTDGSAAFFPGFPLAIRAVSVVLGGRPFAAAFVVSNVALFAALCILYFLTASELSERHARTTILYLAVFPTSFFLFAPYSEALFLLASVASFWAARRNRWVIAALSGAAAALTRNIGVLLVPALLIEALDQHREHGRPLLPRVAAAGAAGMGTIAYLVYWGWRTGDVLAPLSVQQGWQRTASFPLTTLWNGSREAFRWIGTYPGGYHLVDWVIVIPVLVAAGYAAVRLRPAFSAYLWLSLLVPLSYVFEPRPLMSLPRFILVMFPAFWAMADATERGWLPRTAVVAVSAAGLGVLALLFANWYYIF
jgi:Mannosyltransferase (PIG-V)